MLGFSFAAILVGLPAGFGTYEIIRYFRKRNVWHGYIALLYAIGLATFFAYWLPDGKILLSDWRSKMPGALALGCLVGAILGVLHRKRDGP